MSRLANSDGVPAGRVGAAKLRTLLLLVALTVSALLFWAKPSHAATEPEHSDLLLMVQQERFNDLENLANDLRKEKLGFYSGSSNLGLFYERLDSLDGKATDAAWQEYIAKIEKWAQAFPQSPTPPVVLGETYVTWAWKARGGGYADTVTKDGWRLMGERLAKARTVLEAAEELPVRDAELYRTLLKVALGQGWTKQDMDAAFKKGIALDPNYLKLYEAKAYFLLPRWHGEKGEWEAFASQIADARGGEEGDILYMAITRSQAWTEQEKFFKNTSISYERMKRGFEASLRRRPNYLWEMNSYCYFACIAGDRETATQLFDKIKNRWDGGIWSNQTFERWKAWANQPREVAWWMKRYMAAGDHNPKWDALVEQGIQSWQSGDKESVSQSVNAFQAALKLGCQCPIVKFILARNMHWLDGKRPSEEVQQLLRESIAVAQSKPELKFIEFRSTNILGWQELRKQEPKEALKFFEAALAIQDPDIGSGVRANAEDGRAQAQSAIQNAELQRALAEQAAAPGPEVAKKVLEIIAAQAERNWSPYNNLPGTANGRRADDWFNHHKWMDFQKALPASEVLLANSPEDPNVVRMHHFILCNLKRWKDAEEFGVKAIQIVEKSGDRECLFWVLRNQVMVIWEDAHAIRDPAHEKSLYKYNVNQLTDRAVALAEELNSDNLRYRAYFLQAIEVEGSSGSPIGHQWNKAMDLYKKAMAIAEKNGWTDRVCEDMGGVAEVLACIGKLDESEEWSRKAGLAPHPYVAVRRKKWDEIYTRDRGGMDYSENRTLRQPNERLAQEVIGWNERGAVDNFVQACLHLNKLEEAVETAERFHNRTLGMILGAQAEGGRKVAVVKKKETQATLQKKLDTLGGQLAMAQKDSNPSAVESIQRDLKVQSIALQQLSTDIAADELEIQAARVSPKMSVKQIQALLDPNTVLIMYYVVWSPFENEGFIAAITNKEFHCGIQNGLVIGSYEKSGLQPMIEPYLKALLNPNPTAEVAAELRKQNDALYALLLKPISDRIKDKRHVIIIPSGPLCQVPIHLLRDETGHCLIESHTVSYAQSAGVLRYALARNRKAGGPVTVVANPAIAQQGASLKFAELEATAIREVFPDANVLIGVAATETAVKAVLPTAGILHFACHGLLNTEEPMKSALALAPDEHNDGLLTAREVCDYDVQAGLVTLSACESGSGGMSAGWIELVGMSRAWLLAGAPSVMVSLWKLDDRATSELMAEFYKNLKTMSRAEALQRAQLVMMKKYENPYYWGAFVLYGDYR